MAELRTIYITQLGGVLRRAGSRLQLWERHDKRAEFGPIGVEQIVLIGSILLTPSALDLLLDHNIDIVYLNGQGRFRGRLSRGPSPNIALRLTQYEVLREPTHKLEFARSTVQGKIESEQKRLAMSIRKIPTDSPEHADRRKILERGIVALTAAQRRLVLTDTLDEVRGVEGSAAAAYFRAFAALLRPGSGFSFEGRSKRPPKDAINALLSFGYTLLANALESAVAIVGLDPYLGALHAPEQGRASLVYDLMEPYRAEIVDSLVLALVNKRAFDPVQDFDTTATEGVWMTAEARKRFVTFFEKSLGVLTEPDNEGNLQGARNRILAHVRGYARNIRTWATLNPCRGLAGAQ